MVVLDIDNWGLFVFDLTYIASIVVLTASFQGEVNVVFVHDIRYAPSLSVGGVFVLVKLFQF